MAHGHSRSAEARADCRTSREAARNPPPPAAGRSRGKGGRTVIEPTRDTKIITVDLLTVMARGFISTVRDPWVRYNAEKTLQRTDRSTRGLSSLARVHSSDGAPSGGRSRPAADNRHHPCCAAHGRSGSKENRWTFGSSVPSWFSMIWRRTLPKGLDGPGARGTAKSMISSGPAWATALTRGQ